MLALVPRSLRPSTFWGLFSASSDMRVTSNWKGREMCSIPATWSRSRTFTPASVSMESSRLSWVIAMRRSRVKCRSCLVLPACPSLSYAVGSPGFSPSPGPHRLGAFRLVGEGPALPHPDLDGRRLGTANHGAEEHGRHLGEEGVGEDVVHVAGAAFDLGAAAGHLVDHLRLGHHLDPVHLVE